MSGAADPFEDLPRTPKLSGNLWRWPKPPACSCSAYPFPHRPGGGKCDVHVERVYSMNPATDGRMKLSPICACCGLAADTHMEDFGVGAYEFWGATGVHTNWQEVTDCCEAEPLENIPKNRVKME